MRRNSMISDPDLGPRGSVRGRNTDVTLIYYTRLQTFNIGWAGNEIINTTLKTSDGYQHAFSEKPVADASAPCKQLMSNGSANGST